MKKSWKKLQRVRRTTTNFFIVTFKYTENSIVYDMTNRSILVLTVLSCLLIICGSVSADDLVVNKDIKPIQVDTSRIELVEDLPLNKEIALHPQKLSLSEIRVNIDSIISDSSLKPLVKLEKQSEAMGMDAKLKAWLEAPRDEETGEPIYDEKIPVVGDVMAFFGLGNEVPSDPYTQQEGLDAWNQYHALMMSEYKPTGAFGEVIE